jgi:hypothetical protein
MAEIYTMNSNTTMEFRAESEKEAEDFVRSMIEYAAIYAKRERPELIFIVQKIETLNVR